jgi:hypothetical protein
MNRIPSILALLLLISSSMELRPQSLINLRSESNRAAAVSSVSSPEPSAPSAFSLFSLSGGVSPLGIEAAATTNLNSHLNLRATGSLFSYATSFNTHGFRANANLNLASTRISLDIYPFHSGFRISPGILLYNQNRIKASDTVAAGTSFTLNGDTFYSANANTGTGATPVNGTALLNLHATRPAFTITGGWGNTVARRGHWSFPVEVGVALVGAPTLNVNLNGWACYDEAQTQCMNIADGKNPIAIQVQNDLRAQISTWKKDLEPLKTYPIVSAGVAYSFGGRRR